MRGLMEQTQTDLPNNNGVFGRLKNLVMGDGRLSEIIRFGITGTIATAIQYGLYVVLVDAVWLAATVATIIS